MLILHQEYHRSIDKAQPAGYSRHFYDVAKMAGSVVKDNALLGSKLRMDVIKFKQRYYPRAWARHDLAEAGVIKLVPEGRVLSTTRADYSAMREMFFGDSVPSFDEVFNALEQLQTEINP